MENIHFQTLSFCAAIILAVVVLSIKLTEILLLNDASLIDVHVMIEAELFPFVVMEYVPNRIICTHSVQAVLQVVLLIVY